MNNNTHSSDILDLPAVILAGGKGTRLAPFTTVFPKPLMPLDDMPILEIVIRQLRAVGIRNITLSVGYLSSLLQAYFNDGKKWDVDIRYSSENTPLGTAGPIALVDGLDRTFLVMNGDLLTTMDYFELYSFHKSRGSLVTVSTFTKHVKIDLGVLEQFTDGRISDYIEKPSFDYQVSMGIYLMEPEVLKFIPREQRLDLPDLVRNLIARGEKVFGYPFKGKWLDIGRQEDYAAAIDIFRNSRSEFLPGDVS